MTTQKLGSIEVPPIGTGVWAWGDRLFWNYGTNYSRADLQKVFDASLAAGVRFFDTAEIYGFGKSEEILGSFAQSASSSIDIASKFFPAPYRFQKGSLNRALRASLARLNVKSIALYQIHWPPRIRGIEFWMHAMADARELGLIDNIGVSNFNHQQMELAHKTLASRGHTLASNQIEYSLLHRTLEKNGLIQLCHELNITVIAYSPLAQGLLTGKYSPSNPPTGVRARRYSSAQLSRAQELVSAMSEIGTANGEKSPAQVAINWAIQKGTFPIPGAKNIRQINENVASVGWNLSKKDVEKLDSLT